MHDVEHAIKKAIMHEVADQLESLQQAQIAPLQEPDFLLFPPKQPKKRRFIPWAILLLLVVLIAALFLLRPAPAAVYSISGVYQIDLWADAKETVMQAQGMDEASQAFLERQSLDGDAETAFWALLAAMAEEGCFEDASAPLLLSLLYTDETPSLLSKGSLQQQAEERLAAWKSSSLLLTQTSQVPALPQTGADAPPEGICAGQWHLAQSLAFATEKSQAYWAALPLQQIILDCNVSGVDLSTMLAVQPEALADWILTQKNAPSPAPQPSEETHSGHKEQTQHHGGR